MKSGAITISAHLFSHPDFTVGTGILLFKSHQFSRQRRVADFTAGWELNPTPKIFLSIYGHYNSIYRIVQSFLFFLPPDEPLEKHLWYLKHTHNSKYNGKCNLYCHIPFLKSEHHLVCHQIVGGPVNRRSRYQREDSRYKEDCHRTPFPHCSKSGKEHYHKGRQKRRRYNRSVRHDQTIHSPADSADQSAVWIVFSRHTKNHRKCNSSYCRCNNFKHQCHRNTPPIIVSRNATPRPTPIAIHIKISSASSIRTEPEI